MRPRRGHRNDRIREDREVGPASHAIDGVSGARVAGIEQGARGHGEVTAGRKTHDADARRVESPLGRAKSQRSNRTLRVPELNRMVVARPEAVAQDERRHPQRIQVSGDLSSLVVRGEPGVGATRTHDHGRRGRRHRSRQIHRQRRNVALVRSEGPRRSAGPERNDLAVNESRRRLRLNRRRRHHKQRENRLLHRFPSSDSFRGSGRVMIQNSAAPLRPSSERKCQAAQDARLGRRSSRPTRPDQKDVWKIAEAETEYERLFESHLVALHDPHGVGRTPISVTTPATRPAPMATDTAASVGSPGIRLRASAPPGRAGTVGRPGTPDRR